jgi:hypothetical protein
MCFGARKYVCVLEHGNMYVFWSTEICLYFGARKYVCVLEHGNMSVFWSTENACVFIYSRMAIIASSLHNYVPISYTKFYPYRIINVERMGSRALSYTSGVPACSVKTLPDDGGSSHRNMSELK